MKVWVHGSNGIPSQEGVIIGMAVDSETGDLGYRVQLANGQTDRVAVHMVQPLPKKRTRNPFKRSKKSKKRKKHRDLLPGGLADNFDDSFFDPRQLQMGQTVEMEHTTSPMLAREIARDHLVEDPFYYDHLAEMEVKHQRAKNPTSNFAAVDFPYPDTIVMGKRSGVRMDNPPPYQFLETTMKWDTAGMDRDEALLSPQFDTLQAALDYLLTREPRITRAGDRKFTTGLQDSFMNREFAPMSFAVRTEERPDGDGFTPEEIGLLRREMKLRAPISYRDHGGTFEENEFVQNLPDNLREFIEEQAFTFGITSREHIAEEISRQLIGGDDNLDLDVAAKIAMYRKHMNDLRQEEHHHFQQMLAKALLESRTKNPAPYIGVLQEETRSPYGRLEKTEERQVWFNDLDDIAPFLLDEGFAREGQGSFFWEMIEAIEDPGNLDPREVGTLESTFSLVPFEYPAFAPDGQGMTDFDLDAVHLDYNALIGNIDLNHMHRVELAQEQADILAERLGISARSGFGEHFVGDYSDINAENLAYMRMMTVLSQPGVGDESLEFYPTLYPSDAEMRDRILRTIAEMRTKNPTSNFAAVDFPYPDTIVMGKRSGVRMVNPPPYQFMEKTIEGDFFGFEEIDPELSPQFDTLQSAMDYLQGNEPPILFFRDKKFDTGLIYEDPRDDSYTMDDLTPMGFAVRTEERPDGDGFTPEEIALLKRKMKFINPEYVNFDDFESGALMEQLPDDLREFIEQQAFTFGITSREHIAEEISRQLIGGDDNLDLDVAAKIAMYRKHMNDLRQEEHHHFQQMLAKALLESRTKNPTSNFAAVDFPYPDTIVMGKRSGVRALNPPPYIIRRSSYPYGHIGEYKDYDFHRTTEDSLVFNTLSELHSYLKEHGYKRDSDGYHDYIANETENYWDGVEHRLDLEISDEPDQAPGMTTPDRHVLEILLRNELKNAFGLGHVLGREFEAGVDEMTRLSEEMGLTARSHLVGEVMGGRKNFDPETLAHLISLSRFRSPLYKSIHPDELGYPPISDLKDDFKKRYYEKIRVKNPYGHLFHSTTHPQDEGDYVYYRQAKPTKQQLLSVLFGETIKWKPGGKKTRGYVTSTGEIVGKNFKDVMKKKGFTQEDVADATRIFQTDRHIQIPTAGAIPDGGYDPQTRATLQKAMHLLEKRSNKATKANMADALEFVYHSMEAGSFTEGDLEYVENLLKRKKGKEATPVKTEAQIELQLDPEALQDAVESAIEVYQVEEMLTEEDVEDIAEEVVEVSKHVESLDEAAAIATKNIVNDIIREEIEDVVDDVFEEATPQATPSIWKESETETGKKIKKEYDWFADNAGGASKKDLKNWKSRVRRLSKKVDPSDEASMAYLDVLEMRAGTDFTSQRSTEAIEVVEDLIDILKRDEETDILADLPSKKEMKELINKEVDYFVEHHLLEVVENKTKPLGDRARVPTKKEIKDLKLVPTVEEVLEEADYLVNVEKYPADLEDALAIATSRVIADKVGDKAGTIADIAKSREKGVYTPRTFFPEPLEEFQMRPLERPLPFREKVEFRAYDLPIYKLLINDETGTATKPREIKRKMIEMARDTGSRNGPVFDLNEFDLLDVVDPSDLQGEIDREGFIHYPTGFPRILAIDEILGSWERVESDKLPEQFVKFVGAMAEVNDPDVLDLSFETYDMLYKDGDNHEIIEEIQGFRRATDLIDKDHIAVPSEILQFALDNEELGYNDFKDDLRYWYGEADYYPVTIDTAKRALSAVFDKMEPRLDGDPDIGIFDDRGIEDRTDQDQLIYFLGGDATVLDENTENYSKIIKDLRAESAKKRKFTKSWLEDNLPDLVESYGIYGIPEMEKKVYELFPSSKNETEKTRKKIVDVITGSAYEAEFDLAHPKPKKTTKKTTKGDAYWMAQSEQSDHHNTLKDWLALKKKNQEQPGFFKMRFVTSGDPKAGNYFFPIEIMKNGKIRGESVSFEGGKARKAARQFWDVDEQALKMMRYVPEAQIPQKVRHQFQKKDITARVDNPGPRPGAKVQGHNMSATAITRKKLSQPLQIAMKKDQFPAVKTWSTILDYGCGKGSDVELLREKGYNTVGYDPYTASSSRHCTKTKPKEKFELILNNFVLNVIPGRKDRMEVVEDLAKHTRKNGSILVSTRSTSDVNSQALRGGWEKHKDGFLTGRGTFQKGIDPDELVGMLNQAGIRETQIISSSPAVVVGRK